MSILSVDIKRKAFAGIGDGEPNVVIEDLAFSIEPGTFSCILGPSGCGKSTLLNLITGLDTDFIGDVAFSADAAGHTAYVFQSPRLLPWRSVMQNILLVQQDGEADEKLIASLITEAGLEGFEDAFPGQLSLGMQRRASLARAYSTRPKLLVMDEPFVSLDEALAHRLRALLMAMHKSRNTTVLFVTHDSREAIQLADSLIVLSTSPCQVIERIAVDLSTKQRADSAIVEGFRQQHLPAIPADP